VSSGIVVQEQETLGALPASFLLQKSFNCTSRNE
jgi:hypothetical protein